MPELRLVPCNADNWRTYLGWFHERNLPEPIITKHAVLIADEEGLVCGVCIYPTEGMFMFLEHASARPGLDLPMVDRALKFGIKIAREMGNILCKVPMVHVQDKYIARTLEELGFIRSPSVVFYAVPGQEVKKATVPDEGIPEDVPEKKKMKTRICVQCGSSFLTAEDSEVCDECEAEGDKKEEAPKRKASSKEKSLQQNEEKRERVAGMFIVQIHVNFMDGSICCMPLDAFDSKADAQKFLQEHQGRTSQLLKCMLIHPSSVQEGGAVSMQSVMPANEFVRMLGIKGWNYGMVELTIKSPIERPPAGLILNSKGMKN